MKYQPPYDKPANGNDPYVNGDPTTGTPGSIPRAEGFEHTQREIVAIIENSGATPSASDLAQAAKAIRSQAMNYRAAGGTANALTAALTPVPAAYTELVGVPLRLKIASVNTAAATLNINALGAKNIIKADGVAVAAGDLPAGAIVEVIYDGTAFQLSNVVQGAATLLDTQIFYSGGTYTAPADGIYEVMTIAGGGGGGGNQGGSIGASGGSSGSGTIGRHTLTKGQTVTVTIGAGGTAGANTGGGGGVGGATSFGALQSNPGGPSGLWGGNVSGQASAGTGGEVKLAGLTPQTGGTTLFGGPGGHAPFGMGSGGNAGSGVQNGSGYGSGGSGAGPSVTLAGGVGASGICIVKRIR